jgi:hypothetical protein
MEKHGEGNGKYPPGKIHNNTGKFLGKKIKVSC